MTTLTAITDRVRDESRDLDPARVLLTIVAVIPFALGWLVGVAARALWIVVAWAWAAAVVGFRTAKGS